MSPRPEQARVLGAAFVLLCACGREPAPSEHEPGEVARAAAAPQLEGTPAPELESESESESEPCTLVEPPPGFVDIHALLPSAVIAAGYHRSDNFTGAQLPGYEAAGAWLEAETAAALAQAAAWLEAEGLRLIIHDAYRPRRASEAMVEWCHEHDREDLLHGWVAARSEHGRGRAIDVGLADARGEVLDMGSPWDTFDRRAHLRGADGPALERRLLLRRELVRAGFEPYAREWWHFSFEGRGRAPIRDVPYACRE